MINYIDMEKGHKAPSFNIFNETFNFVLYNHLINPVAWTIQETIYHLYLVKYTNWKWSNDWEWDLVLANRIDYDQSDNYRS